MTTVITYIAGTGVFISANDVIINLIKPAITVYILNLRNPPVDGGIIMK